jgi:hypothetical protein
MKLLLAFIALTFSLNTFACPDISGTFKDEDGELLTIVQTACSQLVWTDSESSTTLIADGVERIVEQDGKNVAYGKSSFTKTDFILDLRVVYGSSVPTDYPTHFLTSYRIDKYNNLVEKIESTQGTSYVTFRRQK